MWGGPACPPHTFFSKLADQHRPAVHVEDFSVMKPANCEHKKRIGPAISSGLAARPSGMPGKDPCAGLGIIQRRSRHVRIDPARRHGVDVDRIPRQFRGKAFDHADESAFGRGVVAVKGLAALSSGRTDQDDMPGEPPDLPCFFICATECLISAKTLSRLMAMVLRHCASDIFSIGASSGGHTP